MKKFILYILSISFCYLILLISIIKTVNYKIYNGNYFKVKKNVTMMIVGDSHPESSLNDSLISDFVNVAKSSEAFLYTYIKSKKILLENSSIKTVFIEINNHQLLEQIDETIWGNEFLNWKYCRYSPLMDNDEIAYLFKKNPKLIVSIQNAALKENYEFLKSHNTNYIQSRLLGGYNYLITNHVDSLLKTQDNTQIKTKPNKGNIEYLDKLIKLCKKMNKEVFLFRSPLHPKTNEWANEKTFRKIYLKRFKNIEFLDFGKFPAKKIEYADLTHLNHLGAAHFSRFFNELLLKKLLKNKNKQSIIDLGMEKELKQLGYKLN